MRNFVGSLLTIMMLCGSTVGSARAIAPGSGTHVVTEGPGDMPGSPTWAPVGQADASDAGFAPLSVVRRGVVYSPPANAFDSASDKEISTPDFPAWASTLPPAGSSARRGVPASFGGLTVDPLPEIGAWALILVGVAMIGGALRGLLVANRRLKLLREEEEPASPGGPAA